MSSQVLKVRAALLRAIREYFFQQSVMEVVTSTLRPYGVTDPNLDNLALQLAADKDPLSASAESVVEMFLQTSPEYAMKQLLAEAGTCIYQLCPAYRGGESGGRHRIEFQMLEWYRVGFDLLELADDLEALLEFVGRALPVEGVSISAKPAPLQSHSYRDLFMDRLGMNPHLASSEELADLARQHELTHLDQHARREDYLDGLFALCVEPSLVSPTIVFDYPACQAALAKLKVNEAGEQVADRFEFYAGGLELANAYAELTDADELRQRFIHNNAVRAGRGLRQMALDDDFLAAMPKLGKVSGIALGIERLMMWLLGLESLPQ